MDTIQEPLLYFQFDPPTARPSQDALIRALTDCTRFRLHHAEDSTEQAPHYKTVEFENLALARKAYATLQNCQLRKVQESCKMLLSINEDPTLDPKAPASSKLLNVTELPPEMTASECYDTLVEYGSIYNCQMQVQGFCKITFYQTNDADKAKQEMHLATIGTYNIIVREPSKYDAKDSFKTPRPFVSTPARRVYSEKRAPSDLGENGAAPLISRSLSQPVRITDPVRLLLQNVPLGIPLDVFRSIFSQFGHLEEASLAVDLTTHKRLGVGVLRYAEASQATRALEAMNGQYIQGRYQASQPLLIKLFEPKGRTETSIVRKETSQDTATEQEATQLLKGLNFTAAPFTPSMQASRQAEADLSSASETSSPINRRDASFSSSTTAVTSSSESSPPSAPSNSTLPPELQKHRKLLLLALEELGESRAGRLADLLVQLPEEERKRCIFEESYLVKKVEKAKALFFDDAGEAKKESGNVSPMRLYNRDDLLKLCSTSTKHIDLADIATSITTPLAQPRSRNVSPSASTSPTSPTVQRGRPEPVDYSHNPWSASADPATQPSQNSNSMNLDTLVRFSVKYIMALASLPNPPSALSSRDPNKILEIDNFLSSISDLKTNQQKQKIGERVFKMFKANAGGGIIKNMSKKTVALLDQEDLGALVHLCEEFPDVLVAKAMVMEV